MTNQTQQTSQENIAQSSMKETTFKDLLSQVQFVVPEIQREYVWGENKDIIYNFLNSIKDENAHNIGFLYSYTPNYATSEQKVSYLIDGQQRFTTLYLLAFYRAIKDNSCGEFKKIASNFSYRVRHSTTQFLEQLVDNTEYFSELENIEDKTWFLSYYKQDTSISNMLAVIALLNKYESELPSCEQIMAVKFYNFNIAATGQGEELYISMNSRGEKIQENENLRAKLFEDFEKNKEILGDKYNIERNKCAKKYDNWQEFFWRNRGDNSSADKGFDKFIEWIKQVEGKDTQNELDFTTLEKYFIGLEKFKVLLEKYKEQIHPKANIPLDGTEGNLFILAMLYLFSHGKIETDFVSFARFFANIFYNKGSNAIEEAIKLAKYIIDKNVLDTTALLNSNIENKLLDNEEREKLEIYISSPDRENIEKAFWYAEDTGLWAGEIATQISWSKVSNTFSLDKFLFLNKLFYFIFENERKTDLLRRVLLARNLENYPILFYWNTRYSFIYGTESWKTLFSDKTNKTFFLELLEKIYANYIKNENDYEKALQEIISNPLETVKNSNIEFIRRPEPLAYCQNKIALWAEETGWKLLTKKKTNSHSIHLNTYILYLNLNELFKDEFFNYKEVNNREIFTGLYELEGTCVYFDLLDNIAVDVSCMGINDEFNIQVFSRSNKSNDLSSAERLEQVGSFLKYELNSRQRLESPKLSYDETVSTLKNIFKLFS